MSEPQYFTKKIPLSSSSSSQTFPARLAYQTFGSPSNPAVLLPTCFGGTLATTSPFLHTTSSAPLSSERFFIIKTALLGGGESSSPSNTPSPFSGPNFPRTTYRDNIELQYSLCQSLGIGKLFAYIGFSMGGQQAYHMAVLYPEFVQNVVCIAGSARTSWHNWSFLEGPKHALIHSVDFHEGNYTEPARRGTLAFGRVYSTWALSPEWFRQRTWETVGFKTLEDYLQKYWSNEGADANNLLALLWTWQDGNITKYFDEDEGDLGRTLGRRVKARVLVMPCSSDQYFPPEDSEVEVKGLGERGTLRVVETVWGHLAGGGSGTKEDTEFMVREIGEFLGV